MKRISSCIGLWIMCASLCAQEMPATGVEQQLEDITENNEDAEITDDTWLQQADFLAKNKLDLNTADETLLAELNILSPVQIADFLNYRKLLGKLVSIYEIQAIPSWDLYTIQKLLPYVTVQNTASIKETFTTRMRSGTHRLIARYGQIVQKAKGYKVNDTSKTYYAGAPSRIMIRYKYQFKNLLQYGLTAAKDAGEPFSKKPNRYGFDFYSFHFFSCHTGLIKNIAIGDYTINMGQGLVHWQAMAFGKSSMVTNVKRQAATLRPYNSAGSYYFNRGAAITLQKNKWESTLFFSARNLDANLVMEDNQVFASSIHTSGYHRTQSELADKNALRQVSYGININYTSGKLKAGFNSVQYHFSHPVQKENKPYNLYALHGNKWSNYSVDYRYYFKNVYFFGETAVDINGNIASINSLLASLHPRLDVVLLHRHISKAYQAVNANAFTVATTANNEKGLYAGIAAKLNNVIYLNVYLDIYRFPWLKYRIDGPSFGKDYLLQLNYKPNKQTELYSRYRVNQREINASGTANAFNQLTTCYNRSWRTQVNHQLNKQLSIRHRFEIVWYQTEQTAKEKGFLAYFDLFYKPRNHPISLNIRLQYFDSDSYNSRLYAYENDVLYYYAVPVFYNKGSRCYMNIQYNISKQFALWCKLGHTIQDNQIAIGSGLDEIQGNKRTEIRFLLSAAF